MATKVNADPKYTAYPNSIDILNVIQATASQQYQDRVPVATQDNIAEVGNPILEFEGVANEFISALVNRIGFTVISSKSYNNPLKEFKRGMLEVGESIQEIFVNLIKAEPYYQVATDGKTDCEDLYARRIPSVDQVFHRRNRQDKYPITISEEDLRAAFVSYNALDNFIARIFDAVYSSDEYDEFILTKHVLFEAGNRGMLHAVTIPGFTSDANSADSVVAIRKAALDVGFMSNLYNGMGVYTHTSISDLVIFITTQTAATMSVKVLASAFNMSETEFLGRQIVLDDFGGLEEEGVVAIAVDREFFMIWDTLFTTRSAYNGARLYWNYFLHHHQILSYSPFKNAIAFTTSAPTYTGVTMSPTTATISQNSGGAIQLNATVQGTGLYNPNVTYAITSTTPASTEGAVVDETGLLTIDAGSSLTKVVVTATSVGDPSKTATCTVTVSA